MGKGFCAWIMLMIYLKTFSNNLMTLDLFVYHVNHGKWWSRIGVKSGSYKHSDFLCSPVEPCWLRAPDWLAMYSRDSKKVYLERGKNFGFCHICSFFPPHSILNLFNVISNRNPAEFILSGPIFLEYFTIYCISKNNISIISIIFWRGKKVSKYVSLYDTLNFR